MDIRAIRGNDDRAIIQSIDNLEDKLRQIKATIQDILVTLELQERVDFPHLMGLFASLSNDFSAVQDMMKKSCVPSRPEDNAMLMKSTLLVPSFVSMDEDSKLLVSFFGNVLREFW